MWHLKGLKFILFRKVVWACHEYACNPIDFLARRSRLAFLDVRAAEEVLPKVIDLMAAELNWSSQRKKTEFENTMVVYAYSSFWEYFPLNAKR